MRRIAQIFSLLWLSLSLLSLCYVYLIAFHNFHQHVSFLSLFQCYPLRLLRSQLVLLLMTMALINSKCVYVCICVGMHVYVCICVFVCVWVIVHVFECAFVCTPTHVCVSVSLYYGYVWPHARVYFILSRQTCWLISRSVCDHLFCCSPNQWGISELIFEKRIIFNIAASHGWNEWHFMSLMVCTVAVLCTGKHKPIHTHAHWHAHAYRYTSTSKLTWCRQLVECPQRSLSLPLSLSLSLSLFLSERPRTLILSKNSILLYIFPQLLDRCVE